LQNILLSWSSGKDSAWALHLLSRTPGIRICALLTTFNSSAQRVAMHAVRRALVEEQALLLGIQLWAVELPPCCSNAQYEKLLAPVWERALSERITAVAFGDLFLQDIRRYREQQLQAAGLEPLFPLWQLPTAQLARDMLAAGVRAKITCVDPSRLDESFAGRDYDQTFLEELPTNVDPCGENGEFHTFVYDAPVFPHPIPVETGEVLVRDGFVFADVLRRPE